MSSAPKPVAVSRRPPIFSRGLAVGIVSSAADLRSALRLRAQPDLLELRLDALRATLDEVESQLPRLAAPLIITARDPREGGLHALSVRARRKLAERFLPTARYVDFELRSTRASEPLLARCLEKRVGVILSVHDFDGTPAVPVLTRLAETAAARHADIFKVATRVDTASQLDRLLEFFDSNRDRLPVAAMGIGALGRQSRIELARRGSVLNYGYLGTSQLPGQLSLRELRALLRGTPK